MRTLTVAAQTVAGTSKATQPINIIEISWTDLTTKRYGDIELDGVEPKLLSLGTIDSVLSSKTGQSFSVNVSLDDVDGTILNIMNHYDIHKRPCTIYQHFATNVDITDAITVYKGQISTPLRWDEESRIVSFEVVNLIEDKEVGFAPEEGQFDFVSDDSVGHAWPLVFGSPLHVPAVRIKTQVQGSLRVPFCMPDPILLYKRDAYIRAYNDMGNVLDWYAKVLQAAGQICTLSGDELIAGLCRSIIDEDNAQTNAHRQLAEMERMKRKAEQGRFVPGAVDEKQLKAQEAIVKESLKILEQVQQKKEQWKWQIELYKYEIAVKKEAAVKQVEAFRAQAEVYGKYLQVVNKICTEWSCKIGTKLIIENGEKFPQGIPIDLIIEGVRFRGTFSGEEFTVNSEPSPKYRNLEVGPYQTVLNDCGVPTTEANLNVFYVKDHTKILKGMYALVLNTNDQRKHIIKITEQNGTKCIFDLQEFGEIRHELDVPKLSGSSLIKAVVPFPTYGGFGHNQFGIDPLLNPTFYNPDNKLVLGPDIVRLLDGHEPNETEWRELKLLERLRKRDNVQDKVYFSAPTPREVYKVLGQDIGYIYEVAAIPLASWMNQDIDYDELPEELFWEAKAKTEVFLADGECQIYVANILPSTIKSVMAYRTDLKGIETLTPVPSSYYTKNGSEALGTMNLTTLRFPIPLSSIPDEGWTDDVYVTLTSSVGPNVVDVLIYLINTYTDKTYDATSFASVYTAQANYPVNFALLDKQNVFTLMMDIAHQARCVLWEREGVFHIKYLSIEPTSVRTISEQVIEENSLKLDYTSTDSIVTKYVGNWRPDYLSKTKEKKVVLRHNVQRYGLKEQTENYFIYNNESLVRKSATYWLIQGANTWKLATFSVFLDQIALEVFDCIVLNLSQNYFFNSPMKAIIEALTFEPDENRINLSVWLPVRSGEMTQYQFAWPGSADENAAFPTSADIQEGNVYTTNITGTLGGCV